jgi:hypothetical protein
MKWTTEAPTKPGWYWASFFDESDREWLTFMVFITHSGKVFDPELDDDDEFNKLLPQDTIFTRWFGPLDQPEPPK